MESQFTRLASLTSLDRGHDRLLAAMGIHTLSDLLSFRPAVDAQLVTAAVDGLVPEKEAIQVLNDEAQTRPLLKVVEGNVDLLASVDGGTAEVLAQLGVKTIRELAEWEAFAEAEELLEPARESTLVEDPSAPDCVLPRCRKYTRNSKGYTSFIRARDLGDLPITSASLATPIHRMFHRADMACGTLYLGYAATYRQDWIYSGIHLGEPLGSVSLFMGQDSQVSVLDWKRINRAIRSEDNRVSERLVNLMSHQRAVDEVARATAEEHQHGATSAFGANAATSGSFVAAGAIVGGVGGGVSGALAGLVIGNAANAAGGAPTLAGAAVGTAVGAAAGAAAGALVYSGATTFGFVETEADGNRSIAGDSGQRIHERSMQNASSIRSFWANIVSQSVEEESQRLRTERVTNYNKIHALNAMYFEVLNRYRVNLWLTAVDPLLFLPFRPFTFNESLLQQYWWILREYMKDADLVVAIDTYFLTLAPVDSALEAIEELPLVSEIQATQIRVKLDFDGSAIQDLINTQLITLVAGGSAAIAGAVGLVGGTMAMAGAMMNLFYSGIKREFVRAALVTANGDVPLTRQNSANTNPEYVGDYRTNQDVRIETITGIRIDNDNSALELNIPGTNESFDLSAVAFEKINVDLTLRDRSRLIGAVPTLGDVEDDQNIGTPPILVGGNASATVSWNIANRLRTAYAGITEQQAELEDAEETRETTQARIANLVGFLNANKFGFTRLILQQIEREQLICVLDQLSVAGVPLREIAGTNPVGFSGGHVVLPLRRAPQLVPAAAPAFTVDLTKIVSALEQLVEALEDGDIALSGAETAIDTMGAFAEGLSLLPSTQEPERSLRERLVSLRSFLVLILTTTDPAERTALIAQTLDHVRAILAFIEEPEIDAGSGGALSGLDAIRVFYDRIMALTKSLMERPVVSSETSLPSPAVFMEPVLSQAKGAELYDIRRNSHYDILPSPGIGTVDPNADRSQPMELSPTVPGATLQQATPPNYPLPGTLAAFAAEAGKLDLSAMIQTNASSLATTLNNLTTLATELAKASSGLAGDAQKEVLAQAGKMGEKVGSIVESSLGDMAKLAESMGRETPPSPAPTPPNTQPDRGGALNEDERTEVKKMTRKQKERRRRTLGMPSTRPDQLKYQFQFLFEDHMGATYDFGEARILATFFEYGSDVPMNGNIPIPFEDGRYILPETYLLTPGRKATFGVFASFGGMSEIGDNVVINLPNSPDVVMEFRMRTKTLVVEAESVVKAVHEVVKNSGLKLAAQAALKAALEEVVTLGLGLKLPFKVFDIGAEASSSESTTVGGEASGNLAGEYASSTTATDGTDVTAGVKTKYEVTIPLFAWDVKVY
ncbi:hypothetical protein [Motiliproteus sp. SC1-56]|uniref:hypothetical protein n=1 Tax=Motiliproteus sp. SC1-56 TaxID=2799565 RepID=UPI001A8CD1A3|nr:hypothetical protein [Motiliproteus sp. SC1-56]